MGRNSRDDYQWLVDELLAVEEEEEASLPEEEQQWWEEEAEGRNPGWSYGLYEDEEPFDPSAAVEAPTKKELRKQKKQEKLQRKEEKLLRKKKRKGIGRLMLLALLEMAAILAIIGWWIKWLT